MIYDDIEEVIKFMRNKLKIKLNQIILFGNSLGSAASIHLCSNINYKEINAIILLSPIVSGLKIVNQNLVISNEDLNRIDFFSNCSKITEISCPIFLIHGTKDEIIPIQQVIKMGRSIRKLYQWYPSKGDHNNIITKYRKKFYTKCKMFFDYIKILSQGNDTYYQTNANSSRNISFKIEESYMDSEISQCNYSRMSANHNVICNEDNKGANNLFLEDDYSSYIKYKNSTSNIDVNNVNGEILFIEENKRRLICGNFNDMSQIEQDISSFQKMIGNL